MTLQARVGAAMNAMRMEKFAVARELFLAIAADWPDQSDAWVMAGQCEAQSGDQLAPVLMKAECRRHAGDDRAAMSF